MPDRELLLKRFVFIILNMSSHCLLVSAISDEKSAVALIKDQLYMTSYFSLAVFRIFWKILCVFGTQQLDYNVFPCGFLLSLLIILRVRWVSWIYRSWSFIKFWRFLAIISSNIIFFLLGPFSFFSPHRTDFMPLLVSLIGILGSLFIFLHIFLSFPQIV